MDSWLLNELLKGKLGREIRIRGEHGYPRGTSWHINIFDDPKSEDGITSMSQSYGGFGATGEDALVDLLENIGHDPSKLTNQQVGWAGEQKQ